MFEVLLFLRKPGERDNCSEVGGEPVGLTKGREDAVLDILFPDMGVYPKVLGNGND